MYVHIRMHPYSMFNMHANCVSVMHIVRAYYIITCLCTCIPYVHSYVLLTTIVEIGKKSWLCEICSLDNNNGVDFT